MPQIKSSDLQINTPIDVAAPDGSLGITVEPTKPLSIGAHTFQLQVVDDSGNISEAARVRVTVVDNQKPSAVINAPATVPFGTSFTLDGKRSVDVGGGKIVKYIWTLVS